MKIRTLNKRRFKKEELNRIKENISKILRCPLKSIRLEMKYVNDDKKYFKTIIIYENNNYVGVVLPIEMRYSKKREITCSVRTIDD